MKIEFSNHRLDRRRSGFSLVELLVAIGICGLLIGLALPAIQSARDSSRKVQCANNLKQLGDAYHGFESTYGCFPPIDLMHDTELTRAGRWPTPNAHPISAHYFLLPLIDQASLYNKIDFVGDVWNITSDPAISSKNEETLQTSKLPLFACPSDQSLPGDTNYLICFGTSPQGYTTPRHADSGSNVATAGMGCGFGTVASRVSDGLSSTVAFAERLVGDKRPSTYVPARDWAYVQGDHAIPTLPDDFVNLCSEFVGSAQPHASFCSSPWLMSGISITGYNHLLPPNSTIPDCSFHGAGAYTARSLHGGGVYVLLADGAARFTSESIDLEVWRAMGTMDGGEILQNP